MAPLAEQQQLISLVVPHTAIIARVTLAGCLFHTTVVLFNSIHSVADVDCSSCNGDCGTAHDSTIM